jgi:hypothetical protein
MSASYVIPNVSQEEIIKIAEQTGLIVADKNDHYLISTSINPRYSLQKRARLGQVINIPPDNLQQGGDTASVRLYKTKDADNSWFEMNAVSINHPEIVLDKIAEALDMPWYSDSDNEYWIYAGSSEDD